MGKIDTLRIKVFEKPFRQLTIEDQKWVEQLCTFDAGIGGHVHFVTMFLCQGVYHDVFRKFHGCVIKRPHNVNGKLYCQYPIGLPDKRKEAVEKIIKIYSKKYREIVFFAASDENLAELQDLYGNRITDIVVDRDNQNYILDVGEQIELNGPQFSDRRSKIRRFAKQNNWTYEDITKDNMDECLAVNAQWYENHWNKEAAAGEQMALKIAFSNYDRFNFQGGILRVDGKAVAFHIGMPFNQEIYVGMCIKALRDYRNATVFMLHEFMKRHCVGYRYINGGEDLGIDSLRSYKMSLRPKFLTPFYLITVRIGE